MSLIMTLAIVSALVVIAILSAITVKVFQKRRQAAYEAFIAGLYAGQQPHDYMAQHLSLRALRKFKLATPDTSGPCIEIRRDVNGEVTTIRHTSKSVKRPEGDEAKLLKFRRECVARDVPK